MWMLFLLYGKPVEGRIVLTYCREQFVASCQPEAPALKAVMIHFLFYNITQFKSQ